MILETRVIVHGLIQKVAVHFTYVAPSKHGSILLHSQRIEPLRLKRAEGLRWHILLMKWCYHIKHGNLMFIYYWYLGDNRLALRVGLHSGNRPLPDDIEALDLLFRRAAGLLIP